MKLTIVVELFSNIYIYIFSAEHANSPALEVYRRLISLPTSTLTSIPTWKSVSVISLTPCFSTEYNLSIALPGTNSGNGLIV